MKTVLTSILLCAFLQVVWFSFSTGQTACSTLKDSTGCCEAGNKSCAFFNCSTSPGVCVDVANATSPDLCPTDETATPVCNAPIIPATPNPTADPCNVHSGDELACCGLATDKNCGFFTCTNTTTNTTRTECAQVNSTSICGAEEHSNDNCSSVQPTTSSTTTTTLKPTDVCTNYDKDLTKCCAAALTQGCTFYNCTGPKENTTVCRNESISGETICPEGTKKTVVQCKSTTPTTSTTTSSTTEKPTTTTTQTPTKSPSSGGDSGRKFDGASFIGGMVLCAGLVALAYFGLKFYKSRQERNYHTL